MVADSVALAVGQAGSDRAPVGFEVATPVGGHFCGDGLRLRQILINLVSNARKFTPADGRIEVTVTCAHPGSNPAPLRFAVRDNGIGMDTPTLARVFDRFTQADSSTTRRFGGTGLGLAISSRLVVMMGGQLAAESSPGRGSTFSFIVPLEPAAPGPDAPATSTPLTPLDLHVLVVEDNAVNRRILAAQLGKIGCRCTLAAHGEEALTILRGKSAPDVILMDCHMPQLDGWETTRRIRAEPNHLDVPSSIPIIALSAAVFQEERDRCFEVGMNHFLPKPFKLAELHRALEPLARLDIDSVNR